ncbi:FadR/GntR family transcriptional regulator [Emcibacter nanhaiensis]|uniref:FadR family transcriptional regulator n=1 Tax=Emcibacter nanhaiensis TaxID=1505037 RepID=A0A501PJD3_9PROT|nr:FCD domain-containing protein [Emcibacter nanhaiensis]TPD60132.1 FadR family transcriptional regulator [Emcibacter nanhaiensis]
MKQTSRAEQQKERDLAKLRAYVDQARREDKRRLPPEVQLVEELGISRAKLRGLLKILENEGLIWRHVGKGTFIGERSLTTELTSMPETLTPPEAFEARLVIEPQIAALAARRATPVQIEEMRHCLSQMQNLDDFDQWAVWDERLHRLVAKAAGNKLLLAVYDTIRECAPSGMHKIINRVFSSSTRQESNHEHARFIDAIANHDPENAEKYIREHLQAVRQAMFGDL